MGRPSKAEARDTRREILDAALELFSEGSYFGTSMRQIARAVGVRESALYHHFPSKDAILAALVDEMGTRKVQSLRMEPQQLAAGVDQVLSAFVRSILQGWATPRERKFMRLVLAEGPRLSAHGAVDFPAFIEQAVASFKAVFSHLMDEGLMRRRDPEVAAMEFMAPVLMLRMRFMIFPPGPVQMRRVLALADEHVRYFWEAMRPNK